MSLKQYPIKRYMKNTQHKRPASTGFFTLILFFIGLVNVPLKAQNDPPNILLVIADDLGVDVMNGYHDGDIMPTTPTLDSLRSVGITFENVFSAPKCSPSRASILSGKYGIVNGVQGTPGNLELVHTSIFKELESQTNGLYKDAVIGKWHISNPQDPMHPTDHGADLYTGLLGAQPDDYYAWNKTENGVTSIDSSYITTALTDASIDWVNTQNQPWFLWLAHAAPHMPFHVPPSHMYTVDSPTNSFRRYLAMIESIDYELNRLLNAMTDSTRANTLVFFIGDNGTPGNLLRDYPDGHGKSTLYQGGVRVPMIIAGSGVSRQGVREPALVHIDDLYATILEVAGATLPGGIYNSLSFSHLLTSETGPERDYNYTDLRNDGVNGWAIRNAQYKLIEYIDGTQEFYDLINDSLEVNDLLESALTGSQQLTKSDLEAEAEQIRTASWSCRDRIQNGDEEGIDCGGTYCTPCTTSAIHPDQQKNELSIFPNPVTDYFQINSENQPIQTLKIYGVSGVLLVEKNEMKTSTVSIDIGHLDAQVLLIEVGLGTHTEVFKLAKL